MALSEAFVTALVDGHLKELHSFLKIDRTLCPEIRKDTLTVYYRGGSLLKLERSGTDYIASFNPSYGKQATALWCKGWLRRIAKLPKVLNSRDSVVSWINLVPSVKAIMDCWLSAKGSREREVQQLIVRENNREGAYSRATDYFISDIERVESFEEDGKRRTLRIDLVAIHWPSTVAQRKTAHSRDWVVIEVKYGDIALTKNPASLITLTV